MTLVLVPGCYYTHLASGQLRLLMARDSIARIEGDPATPARLRAQLALVERARDFAARLGLQVGGRYTSYVDWPGDRIVTTVVATRPGEVEARGFTFPIVGTVPYKGFFDESAAESEAASLRADGLDVCVVPVTAYSTLGWMDDPVTAPMLQRSDSRLVETVLHELVHGTVFVESQPAFNEGAARFVGQEAAIRFFAGDPDAEREVVSRVADDRRIAEALLAFREQVAALYAAEPDGGGRRAARERLEHDFRTRLAATPLATTDAGLVAQRVRLNDACLAIGGTYAADTERHEERLARLHGDLPAFIQQLEQAAGTDDPRAAFFDDAGLDDVAVHGAEGAVGDSSPARARGGAEAAGDEPGV